MRRKRRVIGFVGNNGCACIHVPAAHSSVLAVGAMDDEGLPVGYSNWGALYQPNGLLAPGQGINGAIVNGGYGARNGSSFAAPIISGVVALLLGIARQRGSSVDPLKIKDILLATSTPCQIPKESDENTCARYLKGILNVAGAADLLLRQETSFAHTKITSRNPINNSYKNSETMNENQENNQVVPLEAPDATNGGQSPGGLAPQEA